MDIETAVSELRRIGLNVELRQRNPLGIHIETIVGEENNGGYRFAIYFRDGGWTASISLENLTPGHDDCDRKVQSLDEALDFVTAFLGPQNTFDTNLFSIADAIQRLKQEGLFATFNAPQAPYSLWGGMGSLHPILRSVFIRDGSFFNYFSVYLKGSFYVVLVYNESHPVAKLLTFTQSLKEATEALCSFYKSWSSVSEKPQG